MPSAPTGTSIEHKVRLSLLPSTATSTLTASATKQAGDVERGYCDVTKGAGAIPVGTTILVQQNEAQPSVLSKYQVGPAVVTESLYEQLPSLSTTTIASEVPYISLDEFLADETTSTPSSSINEVKQTDLTCNVPRPTRGQTVPYTIQPLEDTNQTSRTQLLPMINGCSLTSSPTSSSSSIEHEDEAMGYNPTGSTVSQLSIFRRQTNNSLQLNFREDLAMVPRLSSTSPVSEVSDEDASTSIQGSRGKDNRRRSKKPVPDEKKDEIYWRRRHKNNLAAKRSREARRQKETDLTKKATILEMEHEKLKSELDDALKQNSELRMRLSKYEEL